MFNRDLHQLELYPLPLTTESHTRFRLQYAQGSQLRWHLRQYIPLAGELGAPTGPMGISAASLHHGPSGLNVLNVLSHQRPSQPSGEHELETTR